MAVMVQHLETRLCWMQDNLHGFPVCVLTQRCQLILEKSSLFYSSLIQTHILNNCRKPMEKHFTVMTVGTSNAKRQLKNTLLEWLK